MTEKVTSEQRYREREQRVNDAIALKEPDRVPVMALFGFFPAQYAGITCQEAMYDYDKTMNAWVETTVAFEPDLHDGPFAQKFWGRLLDAADFKQLKWPGHGIDPLSGFQFVEKEYMGADEYDSFLYDQTDYFLRRYWPRIFGALKPLERIPPIPSIYSYAGFARLAAFGDPEVAQALEALIKVGKEARKMLQGADEFTKKMEQLGFPPQFGGSTHAPFDVVSDFLRGTKGAMLDMHRHPDKLLQAVEQLLPVMLGIGRAAKKTGVPRVFVPLHKCIDTFMSPEQFNTFYWPTLKRLILGLVDEGLNPVVFWEGDCTERLEIIKDIPRGRAVYAFEQTDIFRAKEVLGDVVCIRGNVPLSILCTGTPDDVKGYCKKLIDVVGKGGGFIMDGGSSFDDAKPENVKAMFEFTKEYGVYS